VLGRGRPSGRLVRSLLDPSSMVVEAHVKKTSTSILIVALALGLGAPGVASAERFHWPVFRKIGDWKKKSATTSAFEIGKEARAKFASPHNAIIYFKNPLRLSRRPLSKLGRSVPLSSPDGQMVSPAKKAPWLKQNREERPSILALFKSSKAGYRGGDLPKSTPLAIKPAKPRPSNLDIMRMVFPELRPEQAARAASSLSASQGKARRRPVLAAEVF
jgi:hypothetical protein